MCICNSHAPATELTAMDEPNRTLVYLLGDAPVVDADDKPVLN
jgi:hypothetical protein